MALSKGYSFESERLRYRGIEERDAEAIVAWRSDPANYRNFLDPRPITVEEHLAWFARYMDDQTRYDFVMEDAAGVPVGTCGLSHIGGESCEASYMVGDPGARGRGYATEALEALVALAFRELDVVRVEARILPRNAASMRVAERAGLVERERVYEARRGGEAG